MAQKPRPKSILSVVLVEQDSDRSSNGSFDIEIRSGNRTRSTEDAGSFSPGDPHDRFEVLKRARKEAQSTARSLRKAGASVRVKEEIYGSK